MRISDSPYAADWFAISLRWAALLGLAVVMALGGPTSIVLAVPLALLMAWNVLMTTLASLNARLPFHREINLLMDVVLSAVFFSIQGGLGGPASWAGLLPVLTGAVYFELWGSLLVAVLFAGIGVVSGWSYASAQPFPAFAWFLAMLGLGGLFGLLGTGLMRRLRASRRAWLEAQESRSRIQSERLRAIYELSSALTATLSYKRVLDAALDVSYSALNPERSATAGEPLVGAALLFRGGTLRVGSARRFTSADMRVTFDCGEGLLKRVFEHGEPVLSHDLGYDPELGRVVALRKCASAYCFPLRSGLNVYGALLFAHREADYFTPVRRDLLDIIGRQAVIAVQNASLFQDVVQEKERIVEVHEEARKKLARDLHDGPTQSVAAMAMRISIARRMLETDPPGASEELAKIENLAQHTGAEIRHMLFTLRPLILESQGLNAALKAMADKMHETFGQSVEINVDEQVAGELEIGKQGILFYIVEEAVSNARKHAEAANIWVRLNLFQQGVALLEIEDDGVGFDVAVIDNVYDRRSSLGLINLRERAELINGVLDIQSAIGKGTKVSVYVPLSREAADRLQHAGTL
jgi:signal transduction histidine kinase